MSPQEPRSPTNADPIPKPGLQLPWPRKSSTSAIVRALQLEWTWHDRHGNTQMETSQFTPPKYLTFNVLQLPLRKKGSEG